MEHWNRTLEWNGTLEWNTGMEHLVDWLHESGSAPGGEGTLGEEWTGLRRWDWGRGHCPGEGEEVVSTGTGSEHRNTGIIWGVGKRIHGILRILVRIHRIHSSVTVRIH